MRMNHFAHLVLAQPTLESTVGNLLGDFARGVDQGALPAAVRAGLHNHRAVDRFTDTHPLVRDLKRCFSRPRRRFAGIALDIYFDHLLINHWERLEQHELQPLIDTFYRRMSAAQPLMPSRAMRETTRRMVDYDWFGSYREVDAVAVALDRVAGRIRFANAFDNSIEDCLRHEKTIRDGFLEFYPELRRHVAALGLESGAPPSSRRPCPDS